MDAENSLRKLPQVQRLLETTEAIALAERHGRAAVADAVRAVLERLRHDIRQGEGGPANPAAIMADVANAMSHRQRMGLRRTINATGIVLHTNLGRAPLAAEAVAAMADVASGYCNLEFDLAAGKRGSRTASLEPLLRDVTGAEAALPVNNGAAAILLALSALAGGGEVIVSRGELVEIGGGFRIPDVIRQGGARLVEVGATNKTRIADYRAAISPDTRVLLKVHQSNFRTIGFTAETGIDELAALAREHGLLVVADLGSGLLRRVPGMAEPTVSEALAAGADLVTFSGDKLLGGPQAGIILGSRRAVDPLRQHPLLRAVRLDKMSLAALEATLMVHRDRPDGVPVIRMLAQRETELQARAEHLMTLVGNGSVIATTGFAGGGSIPQEHIPSKGLSIQLPSGCQDMAARLRGGTLPVVARISGDALVFDMLTVSDADVQELAQAIIQALGIAQG